LLVALLFLVMYNLTLSGLPEVVSQEPVLSSERRWFLEEKEAEMERFARKHKMAQKTPSLMDDSQVDLQDESPAESPEELQVESRAEPVVEQPKKAVRKSAKPAPAEPARPESDASETADEAVEIIPLSFVWGYSRRFVVVFQAVVSNEEDVTACNVRLHFPVFPESLSPYQETKLVATSHPVKSFDKGMAVFELGDIGPGETVVVEMAYQFVVRTFRVAGTSADLVNVQEIYKRYAGNPGRCLDLAIKIVEDARAEGFEARVAIGFSSSSASKDLAVGTLSGLRHAWAEIFVPGLGWVLVDPNYRLCAELKHATHILNFYGDKDKCLVILVAGVNKVSGKWNYFIREVS